MCSSGLPTTRPMINTGTKIEGIDTVDFFSYDGKTLFAVAIWTAIRLRVANVNGNADQSSSVRLAACPPACQTSESGQIIQSYPNGLQSSHCLLTEILCTIAQKVIDVCGIDTWPRAPSWNGFYAAGCGMSVHKSFDSPSPDVVRGR